MLPAPPIFAALALSLTMPLLLSVLGRAPFNRLSPGKRFGLTQLIVLGAWLAGLAWTSASYREAEHAALWFDAVAGAAILLTAALAIHSIYSLASYGFTVSMLDCLAHQDHPVSLEAWAASYGGQRGMAAFTRDRIAVLVNLGLAVQQADEVRLSGPFALRFGKLVHLIARLFAVKMEE